MTRRGTRLAATTVAAGLLLGSGALGGVLTRAEAAPAGSAVTKQVTDGPFAGLRVTVSQTQDLLNQSVSVAWSGAKPTEARGGQQFAYNFLQIMQCWGDDAAGPSREQCQYGGRIATDRRGGTYIAGRAVAELGKPVDPEEPITAPAGTTLPQFVPFRSATGDTVAGSPTGTADNPQGTTEFFDQTTTNEIDFAATAPDGTGLEYLEVQTAREAPGLGCGAGIGTGAAAVPRGCWLVVVPRSDVEVDGRVVSESVDNRSGPTNTGLLQSSPLSASNWKHRVQFKLGFQLLDSRCPLGRAERALLGNEMVTEAMASWQPGLCGATGGVYSFSQLSDEANRADLRSAEPAVSFIRNPLAAGSVLAGGGPARYAPAAVSGLAVAFLVDVQPSPTAPEDVRRRAGQRLTSLNLTPRLVAKLLTQSYRGATRDARINAGNPVSLDTDPDFVAANPAFKDLNLLGGGRPYQIVSPAGFADAYGMLWQWISGDADAAGFLAGTADPYGMVVNPNYKGLPLPRSDLPKSDLVCEPPPVDPNTGEPSRAELCPADFLPSTTDMHQATVAASRGDTLQKTDWSPPSNGAPGKYTGTPPPPGFRAVLALTDTATATRLGLPMAALRNASGRFVAPTDASLTAGLATARTGDVPGVVVTDPRAAGEAVYPLTVVTHAAVVPAALDAEARTEYAAMLRYLAGPGQVPGFERGKLPPGYLPLPAAYRAGLTALAGEVARPPATPTPTPSPPPAGPVPAGGGGPPDQGGGSAGSADPGSSGGGSGGSRPGATPPPPTPTPKPGAVASPSPSPAPLAVQTVRTPALPVGRVRYALLGFLIAGGLTGGAGRLLRRVTGSAS